MLRLFCSLHLCVALWAGSAAANAVTETLRPQARPEPEPLALNEVRPQARPSAFARAMDAIRAQDWAQARTLASEDGAVALDIVEWHRLRSGDGSFDDVNRFLTRRSDWPGLSFSPLKGLPLTKWTELRSIHRWRRVRTNSTPS